MSMTHKLIATSALTAALIAGSATAAPTNMGHTGVYGTVSGGFNWLEDQDFDTGAAAFGPVETESETGWDVNGALGYDFGIWRLEAQIGYAENEVDSATAGGFVAPAVGGEVNASYFMGNAYWDIPTTWWRFNPYVGAGIGMADIEFDGLSSGGVTVLDDNESVLAWQLIGGLSYSFSPQVAGLIEYRYFDTEDVELTAAGGFGTEVDYTDHKLLAGLRFNF